MQFKDRLKALRKAAGFKQETVAINAGLRRTEISRLENGTNLGTSHAIRVALAKGFRMHQASLDAYFEGKLELRTTLARIGEADPEKRDTPAAPLEPLSETPTFDRAVAQLAADEIAPVVVKKVRAEAIGHDSERTALGWAMRLVQAQGEHAAELAKRAQASRGSDTKRRAG